MEALHLEYNLLATLPPEIGRLTKLQHLDLRHNRLLTVPREIAQLKALQILNLNNNELTALPSELGQLISLEQAAVNDPEPLINGLWLDTNPLPDPYPILIAAGQPSATQNVLAWLRGELDPNSLEVPPEPQEGDGDSTGEEDEAIDATIKQRPAAFRFGQRDGQIDVLPEPTRVFDSETAKDLHAELLEKAQGLAERLRRANADPRVQASVERLLSTLGTGIEDVRPGLLLSRSRSVEADRNAFNTPQARKELFPDAIAVMDDVLLSLRDLLAAFPMSGKSKRNSLLSLFSAMPQRPRRHATTRRRSKMPQPIRMPRRLKPSPHSRSRIRILRPHEIQPFEQA